MNVFLRFLILSVFITTFASEAYAQRRRNNNNSSVRSNNARSSRAVTTRRPTRTSTRTNPSRVNSRGSVVRNNRYTRPVYRSGIPYRNRVRVNNYRHINRRFAYTNNYYGWLRNNHAGFLHRNWVMYPTSRIDGFFLNSNYPYFVFNGYQHRYSGYDRCNYQLVDSYNNVSIQSYFNQFCNIGYNTCAIVRDNLNRSEFSNRYYCAESFR